MKEGGMPNIEHRTSNAEGRTWNNEWQTSFLPGFVEGGKIVNLMLTLSGISKAYGGRVLFEDTTLQLNRQDRIGLVGPNGAGKSTLFSLILGQAPPGQGQPTT